jgi:hypothetical protein
LKNENPHIYASSKGGHNSKQIIMETINKPSVEELLIPRYKVIAPWPEMERWLARVGDILTDNGKTAVKNQNGDLVPAFEWETFPHLFRKLHWWEEREESEMPEHVRPKNPEEYQEQFGEVVLHVDKRTSGLHQFHATNLFQLASMRWSEWLPATESDYLDYINSQPKT